MKKTLAIFGAGGWGWNWTDRSLRSSDWETLAYVDSNPEVLERIAERGVPRDRLFLDDDEALDAIKTDAATVTIPNPARIPVLQKLIQEGRHVLADKPLVHNPGELSALLKAAAGRKSVFMVAQNYRFFLGPRIAHQWLEGGRYGRLGGIHVRFLRRSPMKESGFLKDLTGALPLGLEMLIHQFDLMRYFLGTEPLTISARGKQYDWSAGAGYDALNVRLEFPEGICVTLDADWGARYTDTGWQGHWEFIMSDGGISLGNPERSWRAYDVSGALVASDAGPDEGTDTAQSMDHMWQEFRDSAKRVDSGFQSPAEVFCSLEDNAKSLAIAQAAAVSVEYGETIDYEVFVKSNRLKAR